MRAPWVRLALPGLLLTLIVAGCQPASSGVPDSGGGWQPGSVSDLAVDPTDGSLLKAGGGISRSTDNGQSWTALPVPSALRPDKLRQVAATAAPTRLFAAGPGAGVVRSDDRGQTWRLIGAGLPSQDVAAFTAHSFRPDTLYVFINGQGVFRTEDSGGRWERMDDGPPAPVAALAHSTLPGSMNTGWLYAATREGPYLSMDCF